MQSIIKKSLNNASSLCEVGETIDKRHEQEIGYCKLTDIKNLCFNTINDNFIEDIVDELQATLKTILNDNDISNINDI
ncbi:protein far1-related sequence 5-like [Gigaspora margarita]|uniref:Protein far1-related sequence 5-like n=1 Tax=Gigaspora margarita TaxID=4874 RepID=A0A8H4EN34_GIGMA|nr:protein far1-related sequence 5-like [Gigaspora margarita]